MLLARDSRVGVIGVFSRVLFLYMQVSFVLMKVREGEHLC